MNRRRLYNVKKIGLLGLLVALILCTQTACQGNNPREEGEEKTAKLFGHILFGTKIE